ncbi:acetyl-CoA carboxylase biotin carboxyl carrier protein [bacterium]|nr:acetyl-CoA carboxylase biotin carboxyl carrier protein [candidate division CSSED10-310 bacterium]
MSRCSWRRVSPSKSIQGPKSISSVPERDAVSRTPNKEPGVDVDLKSLKKLLELLEKKNIHEFEYETGKERIAIRRGGYQRPQAAPDAAVHAVPGCTEADSAVTVNQTPDIHTERDDVRLPGNLHSVIAPIVGTFYRAPAPGAQPYVEEGDMVRKGHTLCIIEAMKLMNEIESDVEGRVVSILIKNGQPVEYGMPLMLIELE